MSYMKVISLGESRDSGSIDCSTLVPSNAYINQHPHICFKEIMFAGAHNETQIMALDQTALSNYNTLLEKSFIDKNRRPNGRS